MVRPIQFTDREAAAVAALVSMTVDDEEPSEIRAALTRALKKLRAAGASDYDSRIAARED